MARLVDFHSHFFSRAFFEALASLSPLPGSVDDRIRHVANVAGIDAPSAQTTEHLDRWLKELDKFGVGHLVTFASIADEAATVAEAVRGSGGRLTGFVAIDPTHPEAPERLESELSEGGFRGAVFFPALHHFETDGAEFDAALAVLDEHDAIAVVHCGLLRIALRDHFGLPTASNLTLANPVRLSAAAAAHPRTRFVIPHFGGGFFREALLLGAQCPNVYVDTSSSNNWVDTQPQRLTLVDLFERALAAFGPERILFGTDSSVFPRGWRRDILLAQREALGAIGVNTLDRDRIFGGNAARLLGLPH